MNLIDRSAAGLLVGVAFGFVCTGCNSEEFQTAKVTGHVMCEGKPAVGGVVSFEPIDAPGQTGRPQGVPGRPSLGTVGEDGSFSLTLMAGGGDSDVEGAVIGPHKVSFIPPNTAPVDLPAADKGLPPEHQKKIKEKLAAMGVHKPLPCGTGISPAEIEVKSGQNEFEFTLERAPTQPKRQPPPRRSGSD